MRHPCRAGRRVRLHTDWLELVRRDPHLPAEHLPADWPAINAEALFQRLAAACAGAARAAAQQVLDSIPSR